MNIEEIKFKNYFRCPEKCFECFVERESASDFVIDSFLKFALLFDA